MNEWMRWRVLHRSQFEAEGVHYENIYTITLTYLPDKANSAKFAEMMFDDDDKKHSAAELALRNFRTGITDFIDRISSVIKLFRMRGNVYTDQYGQEHIHDHFLSYLHQTITGDMYPIDLPNDCAMYIDTIIGAQEFYTGIIPKINDKYIQVIAIDGFPAECYPGILAALDNIACTYRWNTRFIFQDSLDSNIALNAYRRKWEQQIRGFINQIFFSRESSKGQINQDAQLMVQQTDAAIADNSSGLVAYGYYTSNIILMHTDRHVLEENARAIKRIINNMHFSARIETVNTVAAFIGSLPGHVVQNIRRPLLNTLQVSDLLPLSSIWPGREYAPCPFYPPHSPPLLHAATDGNTPFRLNLHVSDLEHTLMFGKTGGGKSTALGLIAAQFRRYRNATIFAFDKGRSLEPLTKAVGGLHFDIGNMNDEILAFSPLSCIEDAAELAWARDWIEMLVELQGVKVTANHRNSILKALEQLRDDPEKTLTNLVVNIQSMELKEALQDYTITGAYGQLLDNTNDNINVGNFSVFEISSLMQLSERIQLPVLLYLFRVIERQMKGQPCLLILDEAC